MLQYFSSPNRFAIYPDVKKDKSISRSITVENREMSGSFNGGMMRPSVVSSVCSEQPLSSSPSREGELEVKEKPEAFNPSKKYTPKMFEIWCMGVATVIGGQYYGWNEGMAAGFGSYCIAQILTGFSFINLAFSLSEMISMTSFSGGAYGMARVMLGFYAGFIVASFELMEYITYISFSVVYISDFFCSHMDWDAAYSPLICLLFYLIASVFILDEDRLFWGFVCAIGLVSLTILLIYCFGSLGYVNFIDNASFHHDHSNPSATTNWFAGGMTAYMHILPFTTWGFGGVESLALLTDMADNPRVNLTYGMAYATVTLFVCMIFIMFVSASLPPGMNDYKDMEFFMDAGWQRIGVNSNSAEWLIIPAQIAMAFGFFMPATRLMYAMAHSNLFPDKIGLKSIHGKKLALLYTCVISYFLCLVTIYVPQVDLTNIPILLAQVTYISDLYAFYRMRVDVQNRTQKFYNPFGLVGAGIAAIVFLLTAVSAIAFQDTYYDIIYVFVYWIFLTLGYYAFAKHHQVFSDDEQKSLLVLHVIQNNKRKRGLGKPSHRPPPPSKQHQQFVLNRGASHLSTPSSHQTSSHHNNFSSNFLAIVEENVLPVNELEEEQNCEAVSPAVIESNMQKNEFEAGIPSPSDDAIVHHHNNYE